jgi:hypothetical protein
LEQKKEKEKSMGVGAQHLTEQAVMIYSTYRSHGVSLY